MNQQQFRSFLLWLHKTNQHQHIDSIADRSEQLAYIDSLKKLFFKQYPLGVMINWVPTDHPINKPEQSGIDANFREAESADYEDDNCF